MNKRIKMLLRVLTFALALLMVPGLVACGGKLPHEPDEPKQPNDPNTPNTPNNPSTPGTTDSGKQGAASLSERKSEVVEGETIHGKTAERAPEGLVELANANMTVYEGLNLEGSVTVLQSQGAYASSHHVALDGAFVFADSPYKVESIFSTWKTQKKFYNLSFMTVINRCVFSDFERWCNENGYNETPPSDDIQKLSDGRYKGKTGGETMYMVPTERWIEFVWAIIDAAMDIADFEYVMPEEPDMHRDAGYSESFKKEWEAYYGEPWQDQASSPEAMLKSQELKVYLIQRAYAVIGERVKQKNPDTKLCIATHSTPSYNTVNCKIASGTNTYLASGVFDAVDAQTWSDTISTNLTVNGQSIKDYFVAGMLGYASYVDAAGDLPVYACTDSVGDSAGKGLVKEEDYYPRYYAQTVSQLMQPEINRFNALCWPARSFDASSAGYKLIQQYTIAALNEAAGKEITLSAGTPGITYLLSDSLSWQWDDKGWSLSTHDAFLGVTYPLVSDGIPLKIASMESLTSADDLKDVTLLLVSFDCQKPQSEAVVDAIAEWVLDGGTMLYIGGRDRYDEIKSAWWATLYGSPLQALLDKLELDVTVGEPEETGNATLEWLGDRAGKAVAETGLAAKYLPYTSVFKGDVDELLLLGDSGEIVGFESEAGKGHVVVMGTPSALYAESTKGSDAMQALAKIACGHAKYAYDSTKLIWAKRGNVVAAHAYESKNLLNGRYIDLFDPELSVHNSYVLEAGQSALLYDVTDLDTSVPRLAFSGGEVSELEETATQTTFKVNSAFDIDIAMRLFCADGLYPESITVAKGRVGREYDMGWDSENDSLILCFAGDHKTGITVTVTWGTTPVKDSKLPTAQEKQAAKIQALGYETLAPDLDELCEGMTQTTYTINASNQMDEIFIHESTSLVSATGRYCDHSNFVTYRFDLKQFPDLIAVIYISANYQVEVSTDGENWKIIQNYVTLNNSRVQGTLNSTYLAVDSAKYAAGSDNVYIRLSSADGKGWGGSISKLELYTSSVPNVEVPVEEYETDQFNAAPYASYQKMQLSLAGNEEPLADAAFVHSNTGKLTDKRTGRYCDRTAELIYCFDLNEYKDAVIALSVCQNYRIEVSTNGASWTVVRDSIKATEQKVGFMGNPGVVGISSEKYASGAKNMYIRLTDADPTDGFGMVITQLDIYYQ